MKPKFYFLILFTLFVFHEDSLNAQESYYSGVLKNPIYLNPSLTGNSSGKYRFVSTYRNQWASILKKYSSKDGGIFFDTKFKVGSNEKNRFGVGIYSNFSEGLGARIGNEWRNHKFSEFALTSSFTRRLGNSKNNYHLVSFGSTIGYTLRTREILQGLEKKPNIIATFSKNYLTISTGTSWVFLINSKINFELGGAIHHLNKPDISIHNSAEINLYRLRTIHFRSEIQVFRNISIVPKTILYQFQYDLYKSKNYFIGLGNKINLENCSDFDYLEFTIWKRSYKIYSISISTKYNSIAIGFNFDYYKSSNSEAYEFSIGYIIF